MENKKYLPLKIVHLLLIAAGITLYIITLISFTKGASVLNIISTVLNIFALAAGFFYMVAGYKKEAHLYYKIFMWLFMIAEIIECTSVFSWGIEISTFGIFRKVFALAVVILLGGAKDYGKVKSNIISITLVVLNLYTVIAAIFTMNGFAETSLPAEAVIFDALGQLILASSAALMVCGKYLDKTERGTN